jgi:hypothetical protein
MISRRERTLDRWFVFQHRWQRQNVGVRVIPTAGQIAAFGPGMGLSVEPLIAND